MARGGWGGGCEGVDLKAKLWEKSNRTEAKRKWVKCLEGRSVGVCSWS